MIGDALGHYRIESKPGEGGMGVVYRATDLNLNRPVAIKFLSHELADESQIHWLGDNWEVRYARPKRSSV